MSDRLPVVAAIPTYNMAGPLSELLSQVLEQEYAEVFVLDDASTDATRDVVADFGQDIRYVRGAENVGSGANRNRVLGELEALGRSTLVHFLDADVLLRSAGTPAIITESFHDFTGLLGGLVYDEAGKPSPWNFGPRQSLHSDIGYNVQAALVRLHSKHPQVAQSLRGMLHDLTDAWPDPAQAPQARSTYWVLEANMVIHSDRLASVGGFDSTLREHDIQGVAIALQKLGLVSRFDPRIVVTQRAIDVREHNRGLAMAHAEWRTARKYGLLQWLFPDGHLKPTHNP